MLFDDLQDIYSKPRPYEFSNPKDLWTDPHISKQMLEFHLNPDIDPASRNRKFLDRSIQWLAGKFSIGQGIAVMDLGCGPGLYTHEFARLGARVTGMDLSENSLNYAGRKAAEDGLDIQYIQGNYVSSDFPEKYGLITMIYNDFCVLNPHDRKVLLKKIYKALDRGGHFVLDVHSTAFFQKTKEEEGCSHFPQGGFWADEEYFDFLKIAKYEEEKIRLQKNTIILKDRRFSIHNYLQCFSLQAIKEEMEAQGLETREWFSDIAGAPYSEDSPEIALVNRKV